MLTERHVDAAAVLLGRAPEFNVDAATVEGLRSQMQMRMFMENTK
jgi:hypothetical protein